MNISLYPRVFQISRCANPISNVFNKEDYEESYLNRTADKILALLNDHGEHLYALLTRMTLYKDVADDLMQELFIKLAWRNSFERASDPFAYAFRTAINLAFDWRRSQKKAPRMESASDQLPARGRSPSGELVKREELQQVLNAIGSLPRLSRDIVIMRYLEQQDYESIAARFGKTAHQVRGLCHKAVARLRSLLSNKSSTERDSGGPLI